MGLSLAIAVNNNSVTVCHHRDDGNERPCRRSDGQFRPVRRCSFSPAAVYRGPLVAAHQSTSLYAAWAEVALGLKDLPEAESRAGIVQQRGGTAWAQWRTDFTRRLEAQRKPSP